MTEHAATTTVLIVDDQAPFRDAARLVVELTDGFDVVGAAECGLAGVQLAAELRPDLVLMDMNMPDIDGFEATRRIRAANPDIRVVMLSTYEPAEHLAQAQLAGAVDFLSKDAFDPVVLSGAWALAATT